MADPDNFDPVERAARMNAFFAPLVPGQFGCVFDHCARDLVLGRIDVTQNLIAGNGYLFAPAVIALADTCAAIGCGANIPAGASYLNSRTAGYGSLCPVVWQGSGG